MSVAFAISETMRGVHHFVDPTRGTAEDRLLYFHARWGAPIAASLNPLSAAFMRYEAKGDIFVQDLTSACSTCRGTIAIDYLRTFTIAYELEFEADGKVYRYAGKKTDVRLTRPLQLIKTHTTCYGKITNATNKIISRSVVHFPPETAVDVIRSFRLYWRG